MWMQTNHFQDIQRLRLKNGGTCESFDVKVTFQLYGNYSASLESQKWPIPLVGSRTMTRTRVRPGTEKKKKSTGEVVKQNVVLCEWGY